MGEENKKTILVVDDEPDIRLFLQTVLEDAGFAVVTADNGKHALERIKANKPDLISLDLVMPRMGGLKLLKYLQKNPKLAEIPFIVVTAHARDELGEEDFLKLKAEKFLVSPYSFMEKPVVPSEYIRAIKMRLGLEEGAVTETDDLKAQIKDRIATAKKEKLEETLKILAN
jgi:two-component system alkaline phosphatase synthesis response regulator PhoP